MRFASVVRCPSAETVHAASAYVLRGLCSFTWVTAVAAGGSGAMLAAAAAAWPLGRLLSLGLARRMTSWPALAALAAGGAGAVAATAAAGQSWLVVLLVGAVAGAASECLFTTAQARVAGARLVGMGPVSMVGGLAGVCAVAWWPGPGSALWIVALSLPAYLLVVRPLPRVAPTRKGWPIGPGLSAEGILLSLAASGPLSVAAVLTLAWFGPAWVPAQQAAYMAGGSTAGLVSRWLPRGAWVTGACTLAGTASWALALMGPAGLVVGRFVAGAALFVAQGRLETRGAGERSGTDRAQALNAVWVTLSVGSIGSSVWLGQVSSAGAGAVAVAGSALAVALIAVQLASRVRAGRSAIRDSAREGMGT